MLKIIESWFKGNHNRPRKQIVVPLEELSTIWLKYNTNFEHPQAASIPLVDASPSGSPALPDDLTKSAIPDLPKIVVGSPPLPSPPLSVGRNIEWSAETSNFMRTIVKPYEDICKKWDALDGIYRIVDLLDKQGTCPSMVTEEGNVDRKEADKCSIRAILSQVTLREHSFRVTRYAIERLKTEYAETSGIIHLIIVAALGHDLGKLPSVRIGLEYAKSDHPILSRKKVTELFCDKITEMNKGWLRGALAAIEDHHGLKTNSFTEVLQQADRRARGMEVAEKTGRQLKQWEEWFDPKDLLEYIKPLINITQTGNTWKAFLYGGSVYCDKIFLVDCAKISADSKKIMDLSLTMDLEGSIKKTIDSLRDYGAVSSELANGSYEQKYEIFSGGRGGKNKFTKYLVPLKAEVFGSARELEENQDPFFRSLTMRAA